MAAKPAEKGDMALFLWGATRGLQPCALIIALRGAGGDLHARGTRPEVAQQGLSPDPESRAPLWPKAAFSATGLVLASVCPAPLGPGLDSGAACPVPESALWGACHASGLSSCACLTAGCCCPLDSGCRLVAHTEAWPPMVWPLPGGDPDLVQEGPPPSAEEGLNLLQCPALGLRHAAAGEHQVHQADGSKEEERHLEAEGILGAGRVPGHTGKPRVLPPQHELRAPCWP